MKFNVTTRKIYMLWYNLYMCKNDQFNWLVPLVSNQISFWCEREGYWNSCIVITNVMNILIGNFLKTFRLIDFLVHWYVKFVLNLSSLQMRINLYKRERTKKMLYQKDKNTAQYFFFENQNNKSNDENMKTELLINEECSNQSMVLYDYYEKGKF